MMVEIKLTDSEVHTLRFYLEKALIDARGMAAVGVCGRTSEKDLESVMEKIGGQNGK